jgi:acetyl-CoA acetyltransferase
MGLEPQIAIAGLAQSRCTLRGDPGRLEELIFETTAAALDDCGLKREDVDSVVVATSDAIDGRCISTMLTAHAAGAYLKDEIKTSDEGSFAMILAAMRLLTGDFHTSLVVSWSKPSESPYGVVQRLNADPFFHRPFGMTHAAAAALAASAYQNRFGRQDQAAAAVVVGNRANGLKNRSLEGVEAVTMEDVARSPYVAYPVRALEMAPPADGVCAMVITTAERARNLRQRPVYLRGMGWATDSYYLGQRDLTRFAALEVASRRAYAMAGITDPAAAFDLAEVYDSTAWHQLLACEALGFCGPGESGGFLASRRLPVNPSGGCLSAFPVFSAGLHRLAEACLQVSGRAGEHQVPGARLALAHGAAGQAGQTHAVFALSAD